MYVTFSFDEEGNFDHQQGHWAVGMSNDETFLGLLNVNVSKLTSNESPTDVAAVSNLSCVED